MKKTLFTFVLILLASCSVCFGASQTASGTLASEIIDRAEALFDDSTNGFMSATEALDWLNDGTLDIVSRTHCLEDVEQETLVAGQISYALGSPFIIVRSVIYNAGSEGSPLTKGSLEHFNYAEDVGHPENWFTWENNLFVYPAANAAAAGGTIDAYTINRPTTVASTSDVLVPQQYDRALVLYIFAQALYKDRQFAKARAIMSEYMDELNRFRLDLNTQPSVQEIETQQ